MEVLKEFAEIPSKKLNIKTLDKFKMLDLFSTLEDKCSVYESVHTTSAQIDNFQYLNFEQIIYTPEDSLFVCLMQDDFLIGYVHLEQLRYGDKFGTIENNIIYCLSVIDINEDYRGLGHSKSLLSAVNKHVTGDIFVYTRPSRNGSQCHIAENIDKYIHADVYQYDDVPNDVLKKITFKLGVMKHG